MEHTQHRLTVSASHSDIDIEKNSAHGENLGPVVCAQVVATRPNAPLVRASAQFAAIASFLEAAGLFFRAREPEVSGAFSFLE
jgi:hypothetical protein